MENCNEKARQIGGVLVEVTELMNLVIEVAVKGMNCRGRQR